MIRWSDDQTVRPYGSRYSKLWNPNGSLLSDTKRASLPGAAELSDLVAPQSRYSLRLFGLFGFKTLEPR